MCERWCGAQDALLAADGPRRLVWLLAPGAPPPQLLGALGALRVFCASVGGPHGDSTPNPRRRGSVAGAGGEAALLAYEPWLEPCRVRLGSLGTEQRLEAMVAAGLLPAAVRLVGEAVGGRGAAAEGAPSGSPCAAAGVSHQEREAVAARALGLLCGLAGCEGMRNGLRCAARTRVLGLGLWRSSAFPLQCAFPQGFPIKDADAVQHSCTRMLCELLASQAALKLTCLRSRSAGPRA